MVRKARALAQIAIKLNRAPEWTPACESVFGDTDAQIWKLAAKIVCHVRVRRGSDGNSSQIAKSGEKLVNYRFALSAKIANANFDCRALFGRREFAAQRRTREAFVWIRNIKLMVRT
jgi:hypothetical protein